MFGIVFTVHVWWFTQNAEVPIHTTKISTIVCCVYIIRRGIWYVKVGSLNLSKVKRNTAEENQHSQLLDLRIESGELCVSVCLDCYSCSRIASKSFYRLLVTFSWISICGFAKQCFILELCLLGAPLQSFQNST